MFNGSFVCFELNSRKMPTRLLHRQFPTWREFRWRTMMTHLKKSQNMDLYAVFPRRRSRSFWTTLRRFPSRWFCWPWWNSSFKYSIFLQTRWLVISVFPLKIITYIFVPLSEIFLGGRKSSRILRFFCSHCSAIRREMDHIHRVYQPQMQTR